MGNMQLLMVRTVKEEIKRNFHKRNRSGSMKKEHLGFIIEGNVDLGEKKREEIVLYGGAGRSILWIGSSRWVWRED